MNFANIRKQRPIKLGSFYPLFTRISLETTKTCTRSCDFCPSEQRGNVPVTMSDGLYNSILMELANLKFQGVVQWFYVNEPLIDKQWRVRIGALRDACPKASIHLTTNWDVFYRKSEEDQIAAIRSLFVAGVNSLNLNDYSHRGYDKIVMRAAIELGIPVVDHCWKRLSPKKRVISCGPLPQKIHTWSGYVSLNEIGIPAQRGSSYCPRPMRHIVVMYDGKVPLCCAVNPTGAEILGDLNQQSMQAVWNSKRMFEYRYKLQQGIREEQCKGCVAQVAYPHLVRRVSL